MAFAALKNDFILRRILGTHPDILRGLLNDLLGRRDCFCATQQVSAANEP